ncbi:MAG: 50S ribosomal protein L22 [Candidatus Vogelbacteria bacterium CG10_big_fil_rev_8_21_14_0_10_49_38]|uniref:Large ribosomal subunit protein uL22 n=1 Tax=Candidatus Vogelbacteria bacterium CG10_big_fil_rev_8_21_14_0_10_49_38 TaxID=1975043 RepID=A0A2H0RIS6_9BACT|nr:MAG: 50S ribosomal protein L22 [bacterium CG10_49_38]PIR46393.1 MAG: 50S ribosomal protein L22 [Candidatus Vogelbacteria bacterium CG10_big_fil_rev_8_21_14_0_10_49_38]
MKAFLKNHHQSPRKTRLVADLIKGKPVARALAELDLTIKKSSAPLAKLIKSAVANAKHNDQVREEDLYIKNITVDKGNVVKRFQPRARGRAFPIRHRLSHIEVVLEAKAKPVVSAKPAK